MPNVFRHPIYVFETQGSQFGRSWERPLGNQKINENPHYSSASFRPFPPTISPKVVSINPSCKTNLLLKKLHDKSFQMKLKNVYYSLFFAFTLLSCSTDDAGYTRGIPAINPQIMEASEDITDTKLIGTVMAEDPNGDALIFKIGADKSKLFKVSNSGELTLIKGKQLDFETAKEHQFTVRVTDGKGEFFNYVTVVVLDVDEPPVIEDQTFEASEDIADTDIIGTVQATDTEGNLTFSITADDNGLFKISEDGMLSLVDGAQLDFETATEHTITVAVNDGVNEAVEAQVTIMVTDVVEVDPRDAAAFVTTWRTTMDNESIELGLTQGLSYDYTIDWGDGTVEEIIGDANPSHIYGSAETYTVAIVGDFPSLRMESVVQNQRDKLMTIEKWGNNQWETMEYAFYFCSNMQYTATDIPNLSLVTDLSNMFEFAVSFNGDIGNWDVSGIVDMRRMFTGAEIFNQDIGDWDVRNVTDMSVMFSNALLFNQDIGSWEVDMVQTMVAMFQDTDAFDQDLSDWNVGNVEDMRAMFLFAEAFNRDLSAWNVSSVTMMTNMFRNAISFNQDLGAWNLNEIEDMVGMLTNSGLSAQNYSATLIGWANNPNTPNEITLGASGVNYCDTIAEIYSFLITPTDQNGKGWTITDDGSINCNI